MFSRNCPTCNRVIEHKNKDSYLRAIKLSLNCVKCTRSLRVLKPKYRSCPICGELIFYTRVDGVKRATEKMTGCKECYQKPASPEGIIRIITGLHARWGTEPSLFPKIYTKGQLASWSRRVIKRDKRACCFCHSKTQLEAHHILSKSKHPEFALFISNGITLCNDCHVDEHRNNGYL